VKIVINQMSQHVGNLLSSGTSVTSDSINKHLLCVV